MSQNITSKKSFRGALGKPSLKKTIFLLTFVNKDFTPPPLIIDEKPSRFGGPVSKNLLVNCYLLEEVEENFLT